MNDLLFYALLIALIYYFFFYLPQQKKFKFPSAESVPVEDQELAQEVDNLLKEMKEFEKELN